MRPATFIGPLVILSLISLIPFAAGSQTPQIAINGCAVGANCDMDPGYVPYTINGRQVSLGMELTLPGPTPSCSYMPQCSTVPDGLPSGTREIPFQVCSTTAGCEYVNAKITYVQSSFALTTSSCCTYYTYEISFYLPVYMNGFVTFQIPAGCCRDSQGNIFPPTDISLGWTYFPFIPNGSNGGCMWWCDGAGNKGSSGGGSSSGGSGGHG